MSNTFKDKVSQRSYVKEILDIPIFSMVRTRAAHIVLECQRDMLEYIKQTLEEQHEEHLTQINGYQQQLLTISLLLEKTIPILESGTHKHPELHEMIMTAKKLAQLYRDKYGEHLGVVRAKLRDAGKRSKTDSST